MRCWRMQSCTAGPKGTTLGSRRHASCRIKAAPGLLLVLPQPPRSWTLQQQPPSASLKPTGVQMSGTAAHHAVMDMSSGTASCEPLQSLAEACSFHRPDTEAHTDSCHALTPCAARVEMGKERLAVDSCMPASRVFGEKSFQGSTVSMAADGRPSK